MFGPQTDEFRSSRDTYPSPGDVTVSFGKEGDMQKRSRKVYVVSHWQPAKYPQDVSGMHAGDDTLTRIYGVTNHFRLIDPIHGITPYINVIYGRALEHDPALVQLLTVQKLSIAWRQYSDVKLFFLLESLCNSLLGELID
jgi:hypothetical protein